MMQDFDNPGPKCTRRRICYLVLSPSCLVLSTLCLTVALVLFFLYPPFIASFASKQTDKKVTILPGHSTYDQFHNPTLPIYTDIYFFNWTNPEAFIRGEESPNLKELGPYSFREYRQKFFNESNLIDNDTKLVYTQLKTFHFDSETSGDGLEEDDTICTINLAMVGAIVQVMQLSSKIERDGAILLMKGIFSETKAKLYICQPARALVFNYTDPLVHKLHTNEILKLMKMNLPTNYVSIQLNASVNDTKPSIIDTGVEDIDRVGQFYQWDGRQSLGLWFDESANMINGTEGLIFKPNLKEGENLTAFVDNTYRSFPLINTGKKTIKGLDSLRYELPKSVFESAFTNPDNARWGSWCPDGLFYIGVAMKPAVPVFASKPRFLDADPTETTDKIHLLPPDRSKQDTFIYVHPLIGTTLQFTRSLQINIQVNYTTTFSEFEHFVGTTYFPIFYITEHSELTESFKKYLMKQGLKELEIAKYLKDAFFALLVVAAAICLFFSACSACMCCKAMRRNRREQYTPIQNDE